MSKQQRDKWILNYLENKKMRQGEYAKIDK